MLRASLLRRRSRRNSKPSKSELATRAARHTMGSRQKASIHGVVTPPASPTPTNGASTNGAAATNGAVQSALRSLSVERDQPCYSLGMNAVRGRVRGGHIEVDATLPEGAEVVVRTGGHEEPFELDDAKLDELERRMADADNGEVEPAEAVLGKLRRAR